MAHVFIKSIRLANHQQAARGPNKSFVVVAEVKPDSSPDSIEYSVNILASSYDDVSRIFWADFATFADQVLKIAQAEHKKYEGK